MDRKMSVSVVQLFVWWSLTAGGFLTDVTAQEPTVFASIVTPEADRKEGGRVYLTCLATSLADDHVVAWRTGGSGMILRWGGETRTASQRFTFDTLTSTSLPVVIQIFNITDLQTGDNGEYLCEVYQPASNGYQIVESSGVMLSVLYFPEESSPICSPAGPITVDPGTELNLRCSSEIGNPAVMIEVSQIHTTSNSYTWTLSNTNGTMLQSLNLTAYDDESNAEFECAISSTSFPNMRRSCTIGPIGVNTVIEPMTKPWTEPVSVAPYEFPTSVIASSVGGGGVILALIISIFVLRNRKHGCLHKSSPTDTQTEVSSVDIQTDLQSSTVDRSTAYMELAPEEATTRQLLSSQLAEVVNKMNLESEA